MEDRFRPAALPKRGKRSVPLSDKLFPCPAGTWTFHVSPYGELFLCSLFRKPLWDLRKQSFKQGFYEFFPRIRSAKFKTDSLCRSCNLRDICCRCPGNAELECGDAQMPIDYYCRLARKFQEAHTGCITM